MRTLFILILFISATLTALSGCGDRITEHLDGDDQGRTWPLRDDMMNLAVLLVDYLSYEFEGGNLSFYPPCESCDADSLPFDVVFNPTWDFANIAFLYTQSGDTLLYATIIWDGTGGIERPSQFSPPDSFQTTAPAGQQPVRRQYFSIYPELPESIFQGGADSAWAAVHHLDIVHDFAQKPYRVGIYLYPPSVGDFNPDVAKWVVFVYRGKSEPEKKIALLVPRNNR